MNQKAIEQLSELIDQRVSEAVKRAKRKRALEREAIVIAQYVE